MQKQRLEQERLPEHRQAWELPLAQKSSVVQRSPHLATVWALQEQEPRQQPQVVVVLLGVVVELVLRVEQQQQRDC